MTPHADALRAFLDDPASAGWRDLPFFGPGGTLFEGSAAVRITQQLDAKAAAGAHILPPAPDMFAALRLTPLHQVKAVILGQDPYPTPGHAHGLAFSYRGSGGLPASLRRIFMELADDLGAEQPRGGDLTGWAKQGVLLLNAALSVEAGKAGAHLKLGWEALADQAVSAVSARNAATAFILWGDKARSRRALIDARHLILESAHPSPLAARGDFMGSKPFSRANAFLEEKGVGAIEWTAL
jgi:uracil-DNA glycosylase